MIFRPPAPAQLTQRCERIGLTDLVLLLGMMLAFTGCSSTALRSHSPQLLGQASAPASPTPSPSPEWRAATPEEQPKLWNYILNSPLGIAALNQLAIEGFISPSCPKTFYVNRQYGEFQTLLQIQCPDERGVSIAQGYSEMRVTFNRFEDSIENFAIERVYPDRPPKTQPPES